MPRALRHVCALWAPSQAAHRGAPKASKVRAVRHAVHVLCRLPLVAKRSNATAGGVLPHDAQASSSWVRGTGVAWDDVRAGAGSSTRGRLRVDVVVRGTSRPFASTGFVLRRAWTSDHNSNEFQQ